MHDIERLIAVDDPAWPRRRAEACAILDAAVGLPEDNFLLGLHASFVAAGGVDLVIPVRTDPLRVVDFA